MSDSRMSTGKARDVIDEKLNRNELDASGERLHALAGTDDRFGFELNTSGVQSGRGTTSPPLRVARACSMPVALYRMKRTLPSATAKLAPPVCTLQKW
jgi:hypothetical protein